MRRRGCIAAAAAWLQYGPGGATIARRWNPCMRIVCPSCQAAYEVPDKLLSGPAKRVRCARCGEKWVPQAEAPAADAPAAPPPAVEPEPAPEPPPPPPVAPPAAVEAPVGRPLGAPSGAPVATRVAARVEERLAPEPVPATGRGGLIVAGLAWLASLALLGAGGWAMVAWRAEVMAAWGASRRLYQWLGLA